MTNGNDREEMRSGEKPKKRARRFGIDHASGRLMLGSFSIGMPRSRIARMAIGVALILCGLLGFLPILGFWMLPLGFLVLSHDLPVARRLRRRLAVWWHRRRNPAG
ncbi:hypothetical protein GGE16_002709 [Rhizobium leguminosarum]|uniref:Transmembrane protein (PGPGW) n=1 Tax=Rhizobium leguminosarum TaxID=384 RepID=A0AAE2SXL4_RHILE|nr:MULTISPECIES: hypothetical protein [Rhizobium]MBB4290669.1 hypothetical protein [Rhizobium leguminosarum]MBB5677173.1 hypothetical protein [Rhizobium leguminosarum]MDC7745886.1 hypothetical protein [Rhizobium sp. BC56]MDC9812507.1 hypothetical protein [Rhizobium sp. MC62]MDC9835591.1 hypothetical protein [Rhizobium sp. MJ37]